MGARKGPHRSLGFAFGAGSKQTALPTPGILLFAEIEHRPLGRRSQSERLVFSQPHSKPGHHLRNGARAAIGEQD